MPKKIFLFTDSLGPGGAQRQFVGLARLLKFKGYKVMAATYYDQPFYKPMLDVAGIPYECFHVNSKLSLPKLIKSLKRFKANVMISFQTDPNSLACVAAKICGIRLIVSERNTHQSISLKDRVIFNLYRIADYVVPNSYSEAKFISENFPFLRKKTIAITNFVDLKKFHPNIDKPKHEQKVIMTAASIKSSKNTKRYIEACIKAFEMGCKANVVWYGVNDKATELPEYAQYTDDCMHMVETSGYRTRIKLLNKRKDIDKAYREADIFGLPSHFEGTPNVICEAMASGLPVMASNVCDNPNFVIPGNTGWLFDQKNISDMAKTIMEISNTSFEELSFYGKESRKLVEKKCSEEVFVNKYIKLIESI